MDKGLVPQQISKEVVDGVGKTSVWDDENRKDNNQQSRAEVESPQV